MFPAPSTTGSLLEVWAKSLSLKRLSGRLQMLGAKAARSTGAIGDVRASVFRQVKRNEQGSEKVNTF